MPADLNVFLVAMWRGRHAVVSLFLERGASVDLLDGKVRNALALAVQAAGATQG